MTIKIATVFLKEWRLLWRDKVGLIFLFILPMCLVLFISLTTTESNEPRQFKLLLINQDKNSNVSKEIIKALKKTNNFVITEKIHHQKLEQTQAENAVIAGKYQALIILPTDMTKSLKDRIEQTLQPGAKNLSKPEPIKILFDPAVPKSFQDQIETGIKILTYAIESQLWQESLNKVLRKPNPPLNAEKSSILEVKSDYVTDHNHSTAPNEVQQNVPAWALFGMFFIITPLSGIIIKERRLGVMDRLSLAPVSLFTLIWGKVFAFICVNLLQLLLMLAVGIFILPLFGFPTLNVTREPLAIFVIGLCASLAATGFGMLIGSVVKTTEQASVIGPFIIVILAAIGGIFVPVYLLPEALKHISNYSPMNWALQAFIDIFVRDANLSQLLSYIGKLVSFGVLSICLATLILSRSRR